MNNKTRDRLFEEFIGQGITENDGGWSKEVWDAAWLSQEKIKGQLYLVELENGAQYHMQGKDIRDVLEQCVKNVPDIAVSLVFKQVWRNTEDEC